MRGMRSPIPMKLARARFALLAAALPATPALAGNPRARNADAARADAGKL